MPKRKKLIPVKDAERGKTTDEEIREFRKMFDAVVAKQSDPDKAAKWELLREYFTNARFKAWFEDHVYGVNSEGCDVSF